MRKCLMWVAFAGMLVMGGNLNGQEICEMIDMKPILSLDLVTQAEFVDYLCEISGLKEGPQWPSDISKMTPLEFYQMEVNLLVEAGFPAYLKDIPPDRVVDRKDFATLLFQIAMEHDERVKLDCKDATTDEKKLDCLVKHGYLSSKEGRLYKEEILSILCDKSEILRDAILAFLAPVLELIVPEEFHEIIVEPEVSVSE